MRGKWLRVLVVAALGLGLLVLAPPASAQPPVDFEEETHFRCYTISNQTPEPANLVTLDDQFLPPTALSVDEPELFCAPTSKNGLPIEEPEEHLTTYSAPLPLEPDLTVSTEDQFGPRTLRLTGARELYVPTQKLVGDLGFPRRLNHYWCYEASGPKVAQTVTLDDQFGTDTVRVERPHRFCNPVEKVSEAGRFRIIEREVHLTCYEIFGPQKTIAQTFGVLNQFETDDFTVTSHQLLCVPSAKLGFTPISG
jgi:hypothetical protein